MARVGMYIDRLDRVAADEIDDVESLRQAQKIAVVFEVAGASSALEIGTIGRAGNRGEIYRIAPNQAVTFRIRGVQRKFRWNGFDSLQQLVAIEVYALRIPVHARAVLLPQCQCFLIQDLETYVFENAHRCIVNQIQ